MDDTVCVLIISNLFIQREVRSQGMKSSGKKKERETKAGVSSWKDPLLFKPPSSSHFNWYVRHMVLKKSNDLKKNSCKPHKNQINITVSHKLEGIRGFKWEGILSCFSWFDILVCNYAFNLEHKLTELKVNGCGLYPKYNECYN